MSKMKETRKILDLSQEEMAGLVGMHQPGIARIESGNRTETIIQKHLLAALVVLDRHYLISEFVDMSAKIE